MLRLRGQTIDGELVEFDVNEIGKMSKEFLVYPSGNKYCYAIDPTTIEAVVDDGQRIKCNHCGQCFDTDIVGVHAHCDNCGEEVEVDDPRKALLKTLRQRLLLESRPVLNYAYEGMLYLSDVNAILDEMEAKL